MSILKNPHVIKNNLLLAFDGQNNIIDMGIIVESITALEQLNISREDLEVTRLGKYVNDIRKILSSQSSNNINHILLNDIAKRAKLLVKKWRDDHLKTNGTSKENLKHETSKNLQNGIIQNSLNHLPINGCVQHLSTIKLNESTLKFKSEIIEESANLIKYCPKLKLKIKKQDKIEKTTKKNQIHTNDLVSNKIAQGDVLYNTTYTRKVKTTAEIMADITSKSKVFKDTPLAPLWDHPPNIELITKSHEQYLKVKKAKSAITKNFVYNIPPLAPNTKDIPQDQPLIAPHQTQHKKRGRHKRIKIKPEFTVADEAGEVKSDHLIEANNQSDLIVTTSFHINVTKTTNPADNVNESKLQDLSKLLSPPTQIQIDTPSKTLEESYLDFCDTLFPVKPIPLLHLPDDPNATTEQLAKEELIHIDDQNILATQSHNRSQTHDNENDMEHILELFQSSVICPIKQIIKDSFLHLSSPQVISSFEDESLIMLPFVDIKDDVVSSSD